MVGKTKGKVFWKSSTLLINAVALVVFLVGTVLKLELITDKDWLLVLTGVLNILNRFRPVEKVPLKLK